MRSRHFMFIQVVTVKVLLNRLIESYPHNLIKIGFMATAQQLRPTCRQQGAKPYTSRANIEGTLQTSIRVTVSNQEIPRFI